MESTVNTASRNMRKMILLSCVIPVAWSCISSTSRIPPAIPKMGELAAPPPSVPPSLYADSNVIQNTSRMAGKHLRNTLVLLFYPTASSAARDSAINAVNGSVAGRTLVTATDGEYLIRIPDDGTDASLWKAIDILSSLPQVLYAGPELLLDSDSVLASRAPGKGPSSKQ